MFGWSYAYSLPSDCDRVVAVYDNADGTGIVAYKIESIQQSDGSYINVIVSDASDIYLKYTRVVTDPNLMTASFRQVLILRLAKIFAISIAKSNPLYQALDAEEQRTYRKAMSVDGQEDFPDQLPEGSWAASRRSRGWFQRNGSDWPR